MKLIIKWVLIFLSSTSFGQSLKDSILTYQQKREIQNNISFYEIADGGNTSFSEFKFSFFFFLDSSFHLEYTIQPVDIKIRTDTIQLYSIVHNNFTYVNNNNGMAYTIDNYGSPFDRLYLIGVSNTQRLYYITGRFCKNFSSEQIAAICYNINDYYYMKFWNYDLKNMRIKKRILKGYRVSGNYRWLKGEFSTIDYHPPTIPAW